MEFLRKISFNEEMLIESLIQKSSANFPNNWKEGLLVKPLVDGGMGSLLLFPKDVKQEENRLLGKQISECQFVDEDGVEVIASLNVDQKDRLFELDIWKTDFSPLISIPAV